MKKFNLPLSLVTVPLMVGALLSPAALAQTPAQPASAAPSGQAPSTAPANASAPAPTATPTTTPTPAAPVTPAPAVTPTISKPPAAPQAAPAPAAQPAQPNDQAVVAQIGTETVTLGEFNRDFRVAAAQIVNQQGLPFNEAVLKEFTSVRPEYLKQYARQRALYQLARATVKPDTKLIDEQLAKAKAGFKNDAEFNNALSATGYNNLETLRLTIERQSVINTYLTSVQKRFNVTDAAVSNYYNLHKSSFKSPAQACVKHILVPQKAEADAILKTLASGGNFAKLAQAKSQDPGSAAKGGDLGCLSAGETVPAFDKASFNGPVGRPQVVQSEYGWHVLIVTKRTPAGTKPLKDVSAQIRDQLSREPAQKYLDSQLSRLNIKTFPAVVTVATGAKAKTPAAAPVTPPAPAAVPSTPAPATPAPVAPATPVTPTPAAPAPATK